MKTSETGVPLNAGGTGTPSVAVIWEIGILEMHISSTREGRVVRAEPAVVRGQFGLPAEAEEAEEAEAGLMSNA